MSIGDILIESYYTTRADIRRLFMRKKTLELMATVLEYEHALEHVIDPEEFHIVPPCTDCQALAQSALDGVNREGFKQVVLG